MSHRCAAALPWGNSVRDGQVPDPDALRVLAKARPSEGTDQAGSLMNSVDEGLRTLIARGFRFQHVKDQDGHLSMIVGFRGWPVFWDRIHIHGEHEASAARMTVDSNVNTDDVVWSYEGDTLSTIVALLELPNPPEPSASGPSYHASSGLWLPPRSEDERLAFFPDLPPS